MYAVRCTQCSVCNFCNVIGTFVWLVFFRRDEATLHVIMLFSLGVLCISPCFRQLSIFPRLLFVYLLLFFFFFLLFFFYSFIKFSFILESDYKGDDVLQNLGDSLETCIYHFPVLDNGQSAERTWEALYEGVNRPWTSRLGADGKAVKVTHTGSISRKIWGA